METIILILSPHPKIPFIIDIRHASPQVCILPEILRVYEYRYIVDDMRR
jgi:hypothetical protein